jgi:hypothetical protein
MRQRQEVQEMPRGLILAAFFVSSACAATIWPEKLGEYQRKSETPAEIDAAKRAQLDESGLDSAEKASYGPFQATAWHFKDTTGAYAASLDLLGTRVGNYVLTCEGKCPKDLPKLAETALPHVLQTAIPVLSDYFPSKGLVPSSERYILGPVSLKAAAPEIPASAVNFDFGTEGQLARYRTGVMLAVFSYPTPSIAREQLPEFQKISGITAKRTGPLVVLAAGPPAASAKLLELVKYQGVVAENEKPPDKPLELKPETAGQMIVSIITLAALLLGFCLLSGLAVGGLLRLARRFGYSAAEGSMITLHLEGK